MEEIWKKIKNFSNYEVSNQGRVRSLDKQIKTKNNKIKIYKGKFLKSQLAWNKKYLCVGIYDDNGKQYRIPIHKLVAQTFIPNPNNYEIINHLDENKFNNCVDNLEWTSLKENNLYSFHKHPERKNTTSILQYDLEGNFIRKWNSIKEAADYYNINSSNISECLTGRNKSSNKFIWKYYYNDNFPEKIENYTNNSKYRKIIQYDLFGNFIKIWDSMVDIESNLKIKIHGINDCCKQIIQSSGNFIWRFYKEDFPRKISTPFKKVIQYDLKGNKLNVFDSPLDAAISINKPNNQGSITGCCKGSKRTAYGFIWKYE